MEYSIRRSSHYLEILTSGAPSEAETLAMLRAIQARAGGLKGAIIEMRAEFGLSLPATKGLVERIPSLGFRRDYRIALVLLDDVARRSAEFAEDVAFNRGIALRVFRERAAAERWLEET